MRIIALPSHAVEAYEALRAQVHAGRYCRTGLTALSYHGMARGLTLMGAAPAAVERHQAIPVNTVPTMPADPALVRVLANMVLRIQAEVQHVY